VHPAKAAADVGKAHAAGGKDFARTGVGVLGVDAGRQGGACGERMWDAFGDEGGGSGSRRGGGQAGDGGSEAGGGGDHRQRTVKNEARLCHGGGDAQGSSDCQQGEYQVATREGGGGEVTCEEAHGGEKMVVTDGGG